MPIRDSKRSVTSRARTMQRRQARSLKYTSPELDLDTLAAEVVR